jgi:hypothetical protein
VVSTRRFHGASWLRCLGPPFVLEPGALVREQVAMAVLWLSGWSKPVRRVQAGPGRLGHRGRAGPASRW